MPTDLFWRVRAHVALREASQEALQALSLGLIGSLVQTVGDCALVDTPVAVVALEDGVDAPIQSPKQLLAPVDLCRRVHADGVGISHQREQLEPLQGLDLPLEVFQDRHLAEVALGHHLRHLQVVGHKLDHGLPSQRILQPDPLHAEVSHFGAGFLVRPPFHALAEIVVQQRKLQQLGVVDLL